MKKSFYRLINKGRFLRRKSVMILASMTAVSLFVGATFFADGESANIPLTQVKQGPVTIKITEVGELRAQNQVTISAVNDKQIIWMAPEGRWVEEGDTLIILASEKYVISSGEAKSSLLVAKAELSKTQSDLQAQKAKEEAALKNYESLPELAKKGFVMESEVEQARLAYMELKSKTMSFQASVDAARANVDRAQRALAQEERKLREGVYVAPSAGLVVYATLGDAENAKKISLGMTPFEGMDLMYLPDISSMMVDAEINEVDLSRVKIGQTVEIRLDAYADTVFNGEISNIADLAKRKISRITGRPTSAKIFQVEVKVLASDVRLKPGLTATVDIVVTEHDSALYVPLESVFLDEQDQPVVYVRREEKFESEPIKAVGFFNYVIDFAGHVTTKRSKVEVQPVVLGESNDRVVIVKEGLLEGDEILLGQPTS
ncbi:MAG TPA: efflux RND transporter periplasmic adaptor subunit [bacterium]